MASVEPLQVPGPFRRESREERVVSILRTGPKEARQLLALTGLSKRTLYHRLDRLEKQGRIQVFPLRQRDRWAGLYALPEHAHLAAKVAKFEPLREVPEALQASIRKGVETLRRRLMRNPDVEEIAAELRQSPDEEGFRRAVYQVAGEMEWRPPTPRELQEANERLKRILGLAGLMKSGVTPPGATPEEIARAREYLAENPERVPELRV
jgi:DNA-binding transcriptional ArsR family regulator